MFTGIFFLVIFIISLEINDEDKISMLRFQRKVLDNTRIARTIQYISYRIIIVAYDIS